MRKGRMEIWCRTRVHVVTNVMSQWLLVCESERNPFRSESQHLILIGIYWSLVEGGTLQLTSYNPGKQWAFCFFWGCRNVNVVLNKNIHPNVNVYIVLYIFLYEPQCQEHRFQWDAQGLMSWSTYLETRNRIGSLIKLFILVIYIICVCVCVCVCLQRSGYGLLILGCCCVRWDEHIH